MPQVNDSSDYTRSVKLRAVSFGNQVANQTKFRAPTAFDSYDASLIRNKGGRCNDLCLVPKHDISNLMRLPYKAPIGDRFGT